MDVTDARLDYLDPWPVLEQANGRLRFSGKSVAFDLVSGSLNGLALSESALTIESLFRPVVSIDASANATVQQYLTLVKNSPLQKSIGVAVADLQVRGVAPLQAKINVPLRTRSKRQADEVFNVSGNLGLSGNRMTSERYRTTLEEVKGALGFTHLGFEDSTLNARYLGSPVVIETHSSGSGASRLSELVFAGVFDNKAVLKEQNLPLDAFVEGKSPWYVNIEIPHNGQKRKDRGVLVTATSNLDRTRLLLPAPLGKNPGSEKRISVATAFKSNGETPVWRVRLGRKARARVLTDASGSRLRSLAINMNGQAFSSEIKDGISLSGQVEELSLDDWVRTIAVLTKTGKSDTPADLIRIRANLETPQLVVGGMAHGAASIRVNSGGPFLNAVIENSRLRGNIRFPRSVENRGEPVRVRIANADRDILEGYMKEATKDASGASSVGGDDSAPLDPRDFPPLNVHLARLDWGNLVLTDVVARTEPDVAGMKVSTLGFAHDHAQLSGEGMWYWRDPQNVNQAFNNQQLSQLDLQVRSGNVGRALQKLGFTRAMAKGKGTLNASIGWQGPLYAPRLDDLEGTLDVSLRRGRILSIEPGAARMIGLFALQSIPRRLSFDFSDITDEGLEYDTFTGQLTIANGNADSKLVQLQGPIGVIDVTGSSSFANQTYNQKVTVLPRISGALPVIGAISAGATAGIGVLIAGPLLKALGLDIDKIGLAEYRVTGSWESPLIQQVRGTAQPSQ